jgi:hypothetical protein
VFFEACGEKKDVLVAETFLKSGYRREALKGKLENYLKKKIGV